MWDKPHLLSPGSDWSLMDPRNFYSMEVPFVMEGDTKVSECCHLKLKAGLQYDWQFLIKSVGDLTF